MLSSAPWSRAMSPRRASRARIRPRWARSWSRLAPPRPRRSPRSGVERDREPPGPGGAAHGPRGGGAVGRQVGVAVEVAGDVLQGDQVRQLAAAGGVDLAAVLAQ